MAAVISKFPCKGKGTKGILISGLLMCAGSKLYFKGFAQKHRVLQLQGHTENSVIHHSLKKEEEMDPPDAL